MTDRHPCNCDQHHCKGLSECPDREDCRLPNCPVLCEDCGDRPDCNGEALNPPRYERGVY